ncbi:MAG: YfhO family protein [Verrucomicrobia bacterium]|nr:YfhO family protein [Verrucomicrobiota bacterium]
MAEKIDGKTSRSGWIILIAVLALVFGVLFQRSFDEGFVHHSNDGPLGAISAQADYVIGNVKAYWQNLNWLGGQQPSAMPTVDLLFFAIVGPVTFAKFIVPFSLLLLGLSACLFFRQLRFHWAVCILGGIAAALNANFFSNAAWGQYSRPLTQAAIFLALAAIQSQSRHTAIKLVLAGFAIGMGIMEGFDVGALYSLYVAGFAFFYVLIQSDKSSGVKAVTGVGRVAVIALAAALIAAHALTSLIGTQVKGIAGLEQTDEGREKRWAEATQWSTPKIETLRVLIPGSHGYRMDTPDGGQYWGRVGQSEGWETHRQGLSRFSGSGEYAGVLVVLLAIYAIAQALRRKKSVYSDREKKFVWFWSVLALISLLLAWGRFGPLYQIVYQIPYFSTIRNPMKFMHPFHMILIILFGYGLQALYRQYVEAAITRSSSFSEQWKKFWVTASPFDQKWVIGCIMFLAIAVLSLLIFNTSAKSFEKHLTDFAGLDAGLAATTAKFSIREVGLFVLFLALSVGAVLAVMSGWFAGSRAKWAGILLGTILVVDLARANMPWIIYYDYKYKYATNPVIEKLREEPYKNRVTMFTMGFPQNDNFSSLYAIEWLQQHFPFYNIQSLDIVQMPREPVDYAAFAGMTSGAFPYRSGYIDPRNLDVLPRYWQLTNTRYILGPAGLAEALNAQFKTDAFQAPMRFDLAPKSEQTQVKRLEDLTVVQNPNGKYALIEFTNALPRAKLYSNWQVMTNQAVTLERLKSPEFDPQTEVIVSSDREIPPAAAPGNNAGTVEISSYAPKKIVFSAEATVPSVLLFNDKYDPNWKVTVDGKEAPLLQANFIMRGVYLAPGKHEVVFAFEPPTTALYISLAALALGLLLCGYLVVSTKRDEKTSECMDKETKKA